MDKEALANSRTGKFHSSACHDGSFGWSTSKIFDCFLSKLLKSPYLSSCLKSENFRNFQELNSVDTNKTAPNIKACVVCKNPKQVGVVFATDKWYYVVCSVSQLA